jgi:hypothetical protein
MNLQPTVADDRRNLLEISNSPSTPSTVSIERPLGASLDSPQNLPADANGLALEAEARTSRRRVVIDAKPIERFLSQFGGNKVDFGVFVCSTRL